MDATVRTSLKKADLRIRHNIPELVTDSLHPTKIPRISLNSDATLCLVRLVSPQLRL